MNESPPTGSAGPNDSDAPARQVKSVAIDEPETKRTFRIGVGSRLYFVLFGAVVLMGAATLLAYVSFNETLRHEIQLAEYSMPNLIDSVDVARKSAIVVNGAFRLVSASSKQEHADVVKATAQEVASLENTILELEARSAFSEQTQLIRSHLDKLGSHLDVIKQSSFRRLNIAQALNVFIDELGKTSRTIERLLIQAVDDQAFYLVSGLRRFDDKVHSIHKRASEDELTAYRNLITVNQSAHLAVLLLDEVLVLSDRQFLTPLEERFESAVQNFLHAYEKLPASMQDNRLEENLARLGEIGKSPEGVIILRQEELLRLEQEQETLTKARITSESLVSEVNNLVAQINEEALQSSSAAREAAQTGIFLLILLNLLGTVGAFVLGSLFVRRYLVSRLVGLADAMREMASGDLEVPVQVEGHDVSKPEKGSANYVRQNIKYLIWNDEVTDMVKALEVFRRYAHEVQRLNLVEKLAKELDAKNENLEQALTNLKAAQEQVIAEQKLASLGQLTAGVAHEIKNPLNFVSNFANVSIELADEIEELMKAAEGPALEEIRSILDELRTSLRKIKEHGNRADNIVRSMLEHSRSKEGEWRKTNLNALLKEYVDLSYHSLRAEDNSFNAAMHEDLDPNMQEVVVVPQDICRVFLNLVTNAFQAMDEKLKKDGGDYLPELTISSRQLDDHVEFRIRDNGPGIPDTMRDKIFEPFMTTKEPGKGTGLGLSLTTDILIRHGGSIQVDTETGHYTEMRVLLPLEPPVEARNSMDNQAE
ncbi:MAG: HAMP domain-containing protein [Nitrospira sp. SB0677_bin_15]|nr:HAMP domain-containing protein [Nitrospira sp. SB0667_bin_9]MYD32171.1 HAMP domain-containing protein [Nitrospira sp. SB0661_bin_20]MYG41362.1 HAMP domain-containing protein [Nitrospira sp. SB0677_bin_15]MYH02146.1 HAMP domain-containing protein [Nitrospira sp. SB0675_bin_23]MYJ23285.1 HAMP domain-containing protein [Nitrospira sp. SB0673_bin_12]